MKQTNKQKGLQLELYTEALSLISSAGGSIPVALYPHQPLLLSVF